MAKDFRPTGISTLASGAEFSLQGVQAVRCGASGFNYKLSRDVAVATALADAETVFPVDEALGADEARAVYVDGVLKTLTVDYTIGDGDPDPVGAIVFGVAPTEGQVVTVKYRTAEAAVVAGAVTWFDTQQVNIPVWDSIIPDAEIIVEKM